LTYYAGKDDSTTVPEDIGRLKLIICHFHESYLGDSESNSSDDEMSGGPSTLQQQTCKWVASQSDEENSENDKDDINDIKDNSEDNSEDGSEVDEPEYSDDSEHGGDLYGGRAMGRGAK
jgi:hypothetical protein